MTDRDSRPTPLERARRALLRRPRYRVLSVNTVSLLCALVAGVIAASVYFFGHRSFFVETERTLTLIAATLFLFLAIGLYHGVRFRKRDVPTFAPRNVAFEDVGHTDWNVSDIDCPIDAVDDAGGCVGAIATVLIGVLIVCVAIFGTWLAVNAGLFLFAASSFAIGWVFYRALRQTFARSRQCKGNLLASLQWAAFYSLLYVGWLFAIVVAVRWIIGDRVAQAG